MDELKNNKSIHEAFIKALLDIEVDKGYSNNIVRNCLEDIENEKIIDKIINKIKTLKLKDSKIILPVKLTVDDIMYSIDTQGMFITFDKRDKTNNQLIRVGQIFKGALNKYIE
jgi:hypothetical protein